MQSAPLASWLLIERPWEFPRRTTESPAPRWELAKNNSRFELTLPAKDDAKSTGRQIQDGEWIRLRPMTRGWRSSLAGRTPG